MHDQATPAGGARKATVVDPPPTLVMAAMAAGLLVGAIIAPAKSPDGVAGPAMAVVPDVVALASNRR